jgi:hypothetical protein
MYIYFSLKVLCLALKSETIRRMRDNLSIRREWNANRQRERIQVSLSMFDLSKHPS